MTIALVVFGAAYFTLTLRPLLGAHPSPSIWSLILVFSLPVVWLWGMKTRRVLLCVVVVPLGLLSAAGLQGFIDPSPTTSVLQVVILIAYILGIGQHFSTTGQALDIVEPKWIQTTETQSNPSSWGVLPVAVAVCIGVLTILTFPEFFVPAEHRWADHRSRVQVVLILTLGIHAILLLDRLSRRHVNWSFENPRLLGGLTIFGLVAGLLLGYAS